MLVPIEVLCDEVRRDVICVYVTQTIEAELQHVGLHSQVPTSERAFLGGLGADIEDAPIGYYRFHFWHNADTSKEHSNYVFLGKHSGYVCISLMADASYAEGRQFYRILIRTVMVSSRATESSTHRVRDGKHVWLTAGRSSRARDPRRFLRQFRLPWTDFATLCFQRVRQQKRMQMHPSLSRQVPLTWPPSKSTRETRSSSLMPPFRETRPSRRSAPISLFRDSVAV